MAKTTTIAGKLVKECLDTYASSGSLTIAKILRTKYPEVFSSIEQARTIVRTYRGARGNRLRPRATHPRSKEDAETCRRYGALLPDPVPSQWAWRELPEGVERWLILADLHMPYHDKEALTTALEHARGSADGVLLLGDVIDAYQLSQFCRDPRCRKFSEEIDSIKQLFDVLQGEYKHIVWKAGNHEVRLERYLMQRAPELFDMLAEGFSFQKICGLAERGIQWVRPQDPIRHHQLAIVHGHEWAKGFVAPVNPARGAFLRANECTISAHQHRKSNHPEKSIFGRLVQCWSVGCMCDLHPDYAPLNKWDTGFAYLTTGSEWTVDNHSIINGKVK